MALSRVEREFEGNERFDVKRRLGAGGMGVVYEVYDRERKLPVALKTLRWSDPQTLYRFKQEFRSLVDIAHPNLVNLHELVGDDDDWMLTMELVHGVSIIEFVRGISEGDDDSWVGATPTSTSLRPELGPALTPPSYEIVKDAFRQLALGTHALHQAGKLHRDIKPSNVLVDRTGRVVLLDFGLITDLNRAQASSHTTGNNVVGTATYMSPEQAASGSMGPPSDWYSVGVMLFEALTGVLPYQGAPLEILMRKQMVDAPAPNELLPSIPRNLSELCRKLMSRDPDARPIGAEVIAALGGSRFKQVTTNANESVRSSFERFFGRQDQLAALERSLLSSQQGTPTIALVHGASGMGKSALVSRFAQFAQSKHHSEVIVGRCYEAESVPFKALDNLIDGIASRLSAMPRAVSNAIVPRDRFSLSRLFPVLRRVEAIAEAPRHAQVTDSHELRARATAALGELLGRYTDRHPLCLVIDDMQWGDVDSTTLLFDILRAADAPAIMLVICYRSEAVATSASLAHFLSSLNMQGDRLSVTEVEVGPLSRDESIAFSMSQLQAFGDDQIELAAAIADESHGNPFFIDELVRYLYTGLGSPAADGKAGGGVLPAVSLDEALRARIEVLDAESRLALELVALAARPLAKQVVCRAAGLEDNTPALAVLRAGHLVRMTGTRGADTIETSHDRLRLAVFESLSVEERHDRHLRLANVLEREERVDPEHLAFHYRGAGQLERAGAYSAAAAAIAADALAFERAASLYRAAIAELPADYEHRSTLIASLGDAEWSSGRLAAAAEAYLSAADGAPPGRALELRRKASEQLLRSAHVDQGLDAIRVVLKAVSLEISSTPLRALMSLLWRRFRVRLRGHKFTMRDASEVPVTTLARIDTCWSIAGSMGPIDMIRGAALQTQHLTLALDAGEPARVARAVAIEAGYHAVAGKRTEARTRKLTALAKEISGQAKHRPSYGIAQMSDCLCEYQLGNWRLALEAAEAAIVTFENECAGMYFEVATTRRWLIDCLFNLGELTEIETRASMWLRDAQRRGDAHLETELRTGMASIVGLMRDQPAETRDQARRCIALWPKARFLLQHYTATLAEAHTYLYEGNGETAHALVVAMWKPLRRSFLMKIQALETEALFLRARTAIAASLSASGPAAAGFLRDAECCAKKLAKLQVPGGPGLARAVRAMIAEGRGDTNTAVEHYRTASATLHQAELHLVARAVELRLAMLEFPEGGPAVEQARAWFQSHNVVSPLALASVFVPFRRL